jgi:putative endonuclease
MAQNSSRPSSQQQIPPRNRVDIGRIGEAAVADHYATLGFEILDRNWHFGRAGELDLVLGRPGLVVICEVKSRRTSTYGTGFEAVTATKQRRLRQLTGAWMREHREVVSRFGSFGQVDIRIDVASVDLARNLTVLAINVIEAAC